MFQETLKRNGATISSCESAVLSLPTGSDEIRGPLKLNSDLSLISSPWQEFEAETLTSCSQTERARPERRGLHNWEEKFDLTGL